MSGLRRARATAGACVSGFSEKTGGGACRSRWPPKSAPRGCSPIPGRKALDPSRGRVRHVGSVESSDGLEQPRPSARGAGGAGGRGLQCRRAERRRTRRGLAPRLPGLRSRGPTCPMGKTKRTRQKPGDRCRAPSTALFRVQVSAEGPWIFVCGACLGSSSRGTPTTGTAGPGRAASGTERAEGRSRWAADPRPLAVMEGRGSRSWDGAGPLGASPPCRAGSAPIRWSEPSASFPRAWSPFSPLHCPGAPPAPPRISRPPASPP